MHLRSLAAAGVALAVLLAVPAQAESGWRNFFKPNSTQDSQLNQKPGNALRSGKKLSKKERAAAAAAQQDQKKGKKAASLSLAPSPASSKAAAKYAPQSVAYTGYAPGTIVIDTKSRDLYYVESIFTARKYKVAVGKEGLLFTGKATIGDKQEWPRWIPTKEMIERSPKQYAKYKDGMDGGPTNPLGARAIYLYQGKNDTHIRIHGTTAPESIGTASSNGCFRMINEHVIELYEKVKMGAPVVVL